jgi:histidine kinase-, DNA gyrase B-, and HSP90-like ATPase
MWSLIEHSASLVEAVIITGFTTLVLGYKSPRHKQIKYIAYTIVSFVNIAFLANYLPAKVSETLPGISQLFISTIFAIFFLKGNPFFKFYIIFINNYMIFLINIPVMMFFNSLLDGNGLNATVYIQGAVRIAILVITKLLFALASYCFYRWYRKNLHNADFSLSSAEWITLLFICAASFAVGLYIFQQNINQYKPLIMTLASLAALAINGVSLYGIFRSAQNRKAEEELKFYQFENEAMKKNLDDYIKREEELRSIKHDIENVAVTTTSLLDHKEYDKIREHYSQLITRLHSDSVVYTGVKNAYINAIIQQKYADCCGKITAKCHSSGIFCDNKDIKNIDIIDICTIIANLLDNAIEAYNKNFENYDIILNLNESNGVYFIEVSNPIEKSVLAHNNRLKTSKPDTKNHGLGIKSVKSRAEKYNGSAEFAEENNRFVARVWLRSEE